MDTLPAGMSYVATGTSPAPSSVVGNEVTWNNVSSLDPSDSTIITLIAHIDERASGTLINDVKATGTPPYDADVHDSDTATVTVMGVSIDKSCLPTTVAPGGIVTYTINCSNLGAANLTNVTITEDYPKGVTFISADPAPDPGTNNMWTIGVLPVGEFRTITIKIKVPDSRDISFTESGSGNYTSEELLNLETKNKSIGLQKSTEAEYQPTTFNFSDSFKA